MSEIQLVNIHTIKEPSIINNFIDQPYYSLFLRQIGLRETRDGENYFLNSRDGNNWIPRTEDIARELLQLQEQEKLSSAEMLSILAFILEKLDRSATLPQYIISYMCRSAVTNAVLQRFNDTIGCSCTTLAELSDKISDNTDEANETINSLKICDPAMGSGHFLITVLNELIAVKSRLGILADTEGNPLYQYKVSVKDNDLLVFDKKKFSVYTFDANNPESKRIQDAFLLEKRTIIENCLYGVDMDTTAVTISRLRLWLEILIHSNWNNKKKLVLPQIEYNLRSGDALVSRFSIREDLRNIFKRIGYNTADYKKLAIDHKKAQNDEEKNRLQQIITTIKKKIQLEIIWDNRNNEDLIKWQRELEALKAPSLFEIDETEAKVLKSKLLDAQSMVDKYKRKIEDVRNNPVFQNAFEWRYEFPEIINNEGDYIGFDLIIGNPPDTLSQVKGDSTEAYKQMNYRLYKRYGEVSCLFIELGKRLLRPDYYLSLMISGNCIKTMLNSNTRQNQLNDMNLLLLVEFDKDQGEKDELEGKKMIFLQHARNQHRTKSCRVKEDFDLQQTTLDDYVLQHATLTPLDTNDDESDKADINTFSIRSDIEKQIKEKIERIGVPLGTWDIQMFAGIKTGFNEAFIIDGKMKDEFVLADYKNSDIIKPLLLRKEINRYIPGKTERWLLYLPWHFPLLYDNTIKSASDRAELRFMQQYPVIHDHLLKYKDHLVARDQEVGVSYEWYALQRFGGSSEWDDFTLQKIVWKREARTSSFCLDYRGSAVLDSTCFITGQHLKYLLGVLNSKLGCYMLRDAPRLPNGDMQISILTLEALKIPVPNIKFESDLISLVNKRTTDIHQNENEDLDQRIDRHIFDMYELDNKERTFIESNISYIY